MHQQLSSNDWSQLGISTLVVHQATRWVMILLLGSLLAGSAMAQDKNDPYKGMYAGYGAKYVVAINDEIRVYMGVTQGQQKVENQFFEYKSILSSRAPVEIKDGAYAYSRGRYEGTFMMEGGKVTGVNHDDDEKPRLASIADLLKHMEADAKALLAYMGEHHDMSPNRVKELVMTPKLSECLNHVDLNKFNLIDLLLAADKL